MLSAEGASSSSRTSACSGGEPSSRCCHTSSEDAGVCFPPGERGSVTSPPDSEKRLFVRGRGKPERRRRGLQRPRWHFRCHCFKKNIDNSFFLHIYSQAVRSTGAGSELGGLFRGHMTSNRCHQCISSLTSSRMLPVVPVPRAAGVPARVTTPLPEVRLLQGHLPRCRAALLSLPSGCARHGEPAWVTALVLTRPPPPEGIRLCGACSGLTRGPFRRGQV